MNEHKHSLSKKLVECLQALQNAGGRAYVREMNLPDNGGPNFQKLRYWYLVEKEDQRDDAGDSRWILTQTGSDFLAEKIDLYKTVWTYRGKPIRFEGNIVGASDVLSGSRRYKRRREYEQDAQTH